MHRVGFPDDGEPLHRFQVRRGAEFLLLPSGSNGWQSLYVRVTANYRLFGNIFVEPFVGLHWLGKGAHGVNRVYGRTLVKGNSWVTGVSLVYSF